MPFELTVGYLLWIKVLRGYLEQVLRNGYPMIPVYFLGTTVNKIEIIDDVKYHFNSKVIFFPHQLPARGCMFLSDRNLCFV